MESQSDQDYVQYVTARLPTLQRSAYLLCGDTHRAADIVQNTLTVLYRCWKRAARADNLDAYVHRILVRRYLDEKRLRWSRVVVTDQLPDSTAAATVDLEQRDVVRSALSRLPRGQRTMLVLRYYCDLSVEDTAEVMRCSTGNVKSQCARGLVALRQVIGTSAHVGL